MTEQQIKRAKRLAEILELQVVSGTGSVCYRKRKGSIMINGVQCEELKPEEDKSLLWDLRLKYHISIDLLPCGLLANVFTGNHEASFDRINYAQIPAALIDCVIEINGGYDV